VELKYLWLGSPLVEFKLEVQVSRPSKRKQHSIDYWEDDTVFVCVAAVFMPVLAFRAHRPQDAVLCVSCPASPLCCSNSSSQTASSCTSHNTCRNVKVSTVMNGV
jgi:hypothetical protein